MLKAAGCQNLHEVVMQLPLTSPLQELWLNNCKWVNGSVECVCVCVCVCVVCVPAWLLALHSIPHHSTASVCSPPCCSLPCFLPVALCLASPLSSLGSPRVAVPFLSRWCLPQHPPVLARFSRRVLNLILSHFPTFFSHLLTLTLPRPPVLAPRHLTKLHVVAPSLLLLHVGGCKALGRLELRTPRLTQLLANLCFRWWGLLETRL